MIYIKSEYDIQLIKEAVAIWKKARKAIKENCKVGAKLIDLNNIAKEIIENNNAECAFHNYGGFPGHICISVNECIIHGVPNEYIIKNGDSITFDIGVKYKNHICDSAFTIIVGNASEEAKKISKICYESLEKAIEILKDGVTTNEIAKTIENFVKNEGYEVIHDFTGHGCGNELHEDPAIPNYSTPFIPNVKLLENMIICIEPMIMTGSRKYFIDKKNNWSVIAKNHKLTSHWEHMILITKNGFEVLTK